MADTTVLFYRHFEYYCLLYFLLANQVRSAQIKVIILSAMTTIATLECFHQQLNMICNTQFYFVLSVFIANCLLHRVKSIFFERLSYENES